jgi:plasmid stabilization system protein ParE
MRQAEWSDIGREDLKEIGRYIGRTQYRPSIAASIMREIRNHCDHLASYPELGTARPDLGESIRVTSWKRWVIIFRPAAHSIDVLRIVDGSRNWTKLF